MFSPDEYDDEFEVSSMEFTSAAPTSGKTLIDISPLVKLDYTAANEVWTVWGKRGSGKSYFLGKLCEEIADLDSPKPIVFCILDIVGAHGKMSLPNLRHVKIDDMSPENLINTLGTGTSVIVDMTEHNIDEIRSYTIKFCDVLNRIRFSDHFGRAVLVCFEECHNFIPQKSAIGDNKLRQQCKGSVDKLIREGRQQGIGIVLISQRPASVLTDARAQAELKFIFALKEHNDLTAVSHNMVGRDKKEVKKILDKVFMFEVGQFVLVTTQYIDGQGIAFDKVSPRKTEHAGNTFLQLDDDVESEFGDVIPPGKTGGFFDYKDNFLPGKVTAYDADEEEKDEEEEEEILPPSNPDEPKLIDYKTILTIGLMAASVAGILIIFWRRFVEKKKQEQREMEAMEEKKDAEINVIQEPAQPQRPTPVEEEPSSGNMDLLLEALSLSGSGDPDIFNDGPEF